MFFTLSSVIVKAQDYDSIKDSDIKINNFSLNQTTSSLLSILGTPSTIGPYHNEVDDEVWLEYKYGTSSFYFLNNAITSFDLRDNTFYFIYPGIKAGNNIGEIGSYFPNSYANRVENTENNQGLIDITINMPDDTPSDACITILYDVNTQIITSISWE